MKSAMTYVISAGLFVLAVIVVLALAKPANATGCTYSGSGCTTPPPAPTPTLYSTDSDDAPRYTGKAIGIGAIFICGGASLYYGISESDWRWCWNYGQEPMATVEAVDPSALTVAPAQPQPDNLYMIKGR